MQFATRDDVHACFRLLLDRPPQPEEEGHFTMVGQPLPVVVKSYLGSAEFRSRGLMTPTLNAKPVQLDGYVVYVDPDDPLIGGAIATGYEPEVTRLFLQHMGSGAVLDVGANCGYFSLLARSRGAEVYAIEPWQRNIQLLYASVAANHWDRVHIIAAAASDTLRTLTIGASYNVGMVQPPAPGSPDHALMTEYVLAIRIDDIVPAETPVSLIKIDVEGYEYRAIEGARNTIECHRPVILSEFAPRALAGLSGRSGREYLELLRGFGYRLSVVGGEAIKTDDGILARCHGIDHVDILGLPI